MLVQIQEHQDATPPRVQAVGIDLGTTHSLVALAEKGITCVLRFEDSPLVPSLWGLIKGQIVCGLQAKKLQQTAPEKVIASIKRLMGRGLQDEVSQNFSHPVHEVT